MGIEEDATVTWVFGGDGYGQINRPRMTGDFDGTSTWRDTTSEQVAEMTASGSLSWVSTERQTSRYGGIMLTTEYANVNKGETSDNVSLDGFAQFIGCLVEVTATVLVTRKSCHDGDKWSGIYPTQTPVGTVVNLGIGRVVGIQKALGCESLIFRRGHVEENEPFWIDPKQLFSLHDHDVELKVRRVGGRK